jgi:3-(3-hydroxy-phenyl)propionate hydroxylase
VFHYWDRHENTRIAAFDHAALKNDTRFPYVLQCERIKIVEEALKMAKAQPNIDLRLNTEFLSFRQDADGVTAHVRNVDGDEETIAGRYLVSAEGARSIVRKDLDIAFEGFTYDDRTLNIEVAYDFTRHGYAHRNYISDPAEWSNLFHWKGPPDRAFPNRSEGRRRNADAAGRITRAAAALSTHRKAVRYRRQQSLRRAPAGSG